MYSRTSYSLVSPEGFINILFGYYPDFSYSFYTVITIYLVSLQDFWSQNSIFSHIIYVFKMCFCERKGVQPGKLECRACEAKIRLLSQHTFSSEGSGVICLERFENNVENVSRNHLIKDDWLATRCKGYTRTGITWNLFSNHWSSRFRRWAWIRSARSTNNSIGMQRTSSCCELIVARYPMYRWFSPNVFVQISSLRAIW